MTGPDGDRAAVAPPALEDLGTVHLVGIGGAGMSVVARLLVARGVRVQGSDAKASAVVEALRADGVTVHVGHEAGNVTGADTLVLSSAVRADNPELVAARAAGLRVLHRSEALAALMARGRSVAVAGAHGKTTTSAMVATTLRSAGLDPSFAIGGSVITSDGAIPGGHLGTGDVVVAEADESDGSFLNYAPTIAVVLNVEPDHLDHYGSREAFEQAFVDFAQRIAPGGFLVACADDPGARALADAHRAAGGRVVTYGTSSGSDVRLSDVRPDGAAGVAARLAVAGDAGVTRALAGASDGDASLSLDLRLQVPGAHNALNAAAAVATAILLGVSAEQAVSGVGEFLGTGRRFEARGEAGGVRVVDDYAHHPTEVAALLAAARPVAAGGRVLVLFQPHLFSRTRTFAREFADALSLADEVVVTGVYAAREDPDPTTGSWTITDLMAGGSARGVEDRFEAARTIAASARPGDLLLTVGAGDVTELGAVVLDALSGQGSAAPVGEGDD
ncbi:UDP-N-acetylmuramate--L-alanine ligase [Oerskovia sp. KBS0722]|uniref:UDP-N-acetylmuramate--L-alanine ligase n=1 Tax=Oerskovia sp. KBS0722 TaxID=1179673 RepID=UPI00110E90F0|nr:UDP-N-acetylmuramate--L-alanine ligase [Oerskovia sp. KBS0722]QDW63097.1 UDP-N-acetylmuramate--L-alanine ligase [Oerskovia sp. KBS0722]